MNKQLRVSIAAVTAILITVLGAYAVAQQGPAAEKPAAEKKGAHGHMMHGDGMQGGMGTMQCGQGCPMMGSDLADVQIEKTKTGAIIRLSAKSPADVDKVQRMALMAAVHMGADASAMIPAPSAARPSKP